MKDWIKEIVFGIILLVIGIFTVRIWYHQVIELILGAIPILAFFFGGILLWIGVEDKKLEKEIKELEKELENESGEESGENKGSPSKE